jgi:putative ABC transport system permease protein
MMKAINLPALMESARIGADALRANPLRTVLSTTGVIIGVAALVAAFAITDGVDVWSRALITRESSVQDVAITPKVSEIVNGRRVRVHGAPQFTAKDAEAAQREIPGVLRHALMLNGTANAEYLDRRSPVQMTLATASLVEFGGLNLAAGRFYNETEVNHGAPVIVLGHHLAEELAGSRDPLWLVGRPIRVSGSQREVVGVLAPPEFGPETDLIAFAPVRGGLELIDRGSASQPPTLRLKARSIEAVDSLRRAAEQWLAERYGLRASNVNIEVGTQRLENTRQAMLLTKLLLGILVALILAVGGIGIMNVLLAAVAERTREIGIRKAVGARARDIQTQFLFESVTVTGVGSALGFVLGMLIAFAGTAVFRAWAGAEIYPVLKPATAVLAVMSAVIVGVVFGTYPARRAARLSPIDAIARE